MLWVILILMFLLIINGIFAMSELALMTSRRSRLEHAALHGNRGAAAALSLARDPSRFLSTAQFGITLIGIFSGAYGERVLSNAIQGPIAEIPALAHYADTIAMVVVVLFITYFTLVLGELVPKRWALAHPEAVASKIARPLNAISLVALPAVKVLSWSTDLVLKVLRVKSRADEDVSEEDIKALVARAATTGVFDPMEHKLFQRLFKLGDLRVGALMVPRSEIIWLEEDAPIEHVRVLIGTSPYSHFPICKGGLDQLVGVVHIKDLIAYGLLTGTNFKVSEVAHKPLFVPETMPAVKLLDEFQKTKVHVAFVVDEYGGTEGLITINDVVQAILGDVSRRTEESPPEAVQRADGSWLLDGYLAVHEVMAVLGLPPEKVEETSGVNTAAGLVVSLLGHLPKKGEAVDWSGWRLEVVDMDDRRVDQVLATKLPEASA